MLVVANLVPRPSLPAFNVTRKACNIKSWERGPGDEARLLLSMSRGIGGVSRYWLLMRVQIGHKDDGKI